MTNDAKLGMLAGVLGVIVAAVLFANAPPGPTAEAPPKEKPPPEAVPPPAATPAGSRQADTVALPSTPVPRTRKDLDVQPASRQGGADEEP